MVFAQIGDGDILAVAADGTVCRPLPPDDTPVGNETASLSDLDPAASLRVVSVSAEAVPPLVVLSTDGYANSFRSDRDFLQVGSDLLKMIREEGFEPIADALPEWLTEASAIGSGDDITLGLLYRPPIEVPRT